jgi:hypothetical protein
MLSLLALLACGGALGPLDADSFNKRYADLACEVNRDCFRGFYDYYWGEMSVCVQDLLDEAEELEIYYEDCSFSQDRARDCLEAMEAATCAEYYADQETIFAECLEVWDCGGATGTAGTDTGS